jgi:hypothetical protein
MRRVILSLMALLVIAGASGCRKPKPTGPQYVEEAPSELAEAVNVADPRQSVQLLRGFYDIEQNAWRWTAPEFAVALRPPDQKPVALFLDFVVPEVFLERTQGGATLSIKVKGQALPPETIAKAGNARIERTIPDALATGEDLTVEFSLDKFIEGTASDERKLGLIVSGVGLRPLAASAPAK